MRIKKQILSVVLAIAMLFTLYVPTFAIQFPAVTASSNITVALGDDVTGISLNMDGRIYLVKSGETVTDIDSLSALENDRKAFSVSALEDASTTISTKKLKPGVYNIYGVDQDNYVSAPCDKTVTIVNCFAGGMGTKEDPFQITTAEQLGKVSIFRDTYYILNNDIDLEGKSWTPIDECRRIHFDGNYHIIKGLKIDVDVSGKYENGVGLFSTLMECEIKRLGIVDADVKGNNSVGILAGCFFGSHVEEVFTTGNVSGSAAVGGLIGYESEAADTILNCYSTATVKGGAVCGGLTGLVLSSSVKNSYSAGNVVLDNSITFTSEAGITSGDYFGGFVGSDKFEGAPNGNDIFVSNYFNTQTSGQTGTIGATGKTTAEMKSKTTFLAGTGEQVWDFTNVWGISSSINNGYPYLKGFFKSVKAIEHKTDSAVDAIIEGVDGTTFNPAIELSIKDITAELPSEEKATFNAGVKIVAGGKEIKELFDIKLLLEGVPVQPDGTVKIKIKLTPEMLAIKDLQIVYIDNAGKSTIIPHTIEDGYLIFTTNHFSNYALIGSVTATPVSNPKTDNSPIFLILLTALSFVMIVIPKKKKN